MNISVFDLFKIGIGPSSSHTVGPMKAAKMFAESLSQAGVLAQTERVRSELFGSLGATGRGHHSDKAVLLGLAGHMPEGIDVNHIPEILSEIRSQHKIPLLGQHLIDFDETEDLLFKRKALEYHPNGLVFSAHGQAGELIASKTYFSIGGGFIVEQSEPGGTGIEEEVVEVPHPFDTTEQLLEWCDLTGLSISGVMLENEKAQHSEVEVRDRLWQIWLVMDGCIERGCRTDGFLPGELSVKRRAPGLYEKFSTATVEDRNDPLNVLDWVNLYAMAVNEENAAGGRVVTAPTNGAAGIVPAVLKYWLQFGPKMSDSDQRKSVEIFLLTAGAIGALYKKNASLSGAELGCQGEVGVACSMAAGALAEVSGGTPHQVENAAEIGMEHNLGLTCDPVGGLVQIPCIERNAMGAIKAINAARIALRGDGYHYVSLDKVIKTMRDTGRDMKSKYKETSRGGLAVNVIEC